MRSRETKTAVMRINNIEVTSKSRRIKTWV